MAMVVSWFESGKIMFILCSYSDNSLTIKCDLDTPYTEIVVQIQLVIVILLSIVKLPQVATRLNSMGIPAANNDADLYLLKSTLDEIWIQ